MADLEFSMVHTVYSAASKSAALKMRKECLHLKEDKMVFNCVGEEAFWLRCNKRGPYWFDPILCYSGFFVRNLHPTNLMYFASQ